jgi:uncharacterized protein (TIGR00369 family)
MNGSELWIGVSSAEQLKAMIDGRLPRPPISGLLGFQLAEVRKGFAAFAGLPGPQHYNPIGSVHGGFGATLLDSCMGCAVHSSLDAGTGYTTLEFKVNFVRGMTDKTGPVRAEGTLLSGGRRAATAEGRVIDSSGRLLAHGTTTCLVMPL